MEEIPTPQEATATPAGQDISTEDANRAEAMKGMAISLLSTARAIIDERRLDPKPNHTNLAWTFFATEHTEGNLASSPKVTTIEKLTSIDKYLFLL